MQQQREELRGGVHVSRAYCPAELLGDECLSATFFAPTSQAIARSNWGDLASPGPNITGSLLYHLIPFEVRRRSSHACRCHTSVLMHAQHDDDQN